MRKSLKEEKNEEVIEGEEVQSVWDLKKIIVGFVILIIILIVASYVFIPTRYAGESDYRETLGASTSDEPPPLPDASDVDKILNNAQKALSNITSENLTSSQAAIQKIITDLQKLQESEGVGDVFCS